MTRFVNRQDRTVVSSRSRRRLVSVRLTENAFRALHGEPRQ
jgi:hypothetical protein